MIVALVFVLAFFGGLGWYITRGNSTPNTDQAQPLPTPREMGVKATDSPADITPDGGGAGAIVSVQEGDQIHVKKAIDVWTDPSLSGKKYRRESSTKYVYYVGEVQENAFQFCLLRSDETLVCNWWTKFDSVDQNLTANLQRAKAAAAAQAAEQAIPTDQATHTAAPTAAAAGNSAAEGDKPEQAEYSLPGLILEVFFVFVAVLTIIGIVVGILVRTGRWPSRLTLRIRRRPKYNTVVTKTPANAKTVPSAPPSPQRAAQPNTTVPPGGSSVRDAGINLPADANQRVDDFGNLPKKGTPTSTDPQESYERVVLEDGYVLKEDEEVIPGPEFGNGVYYDEVVKKTNHNDLVHTVRIPRRMQSANQAPVAAQKTATPATEYTDWWRGQEHIV